MRHGLTLILSAALIAVLAADASAQDRSGGWFGVGGGWGSANLSCDECGGDSDRQSSGVIYFNGGYTVNERLLAGAEFNLWTKTFEDPEFGTADVNFYNLLATVTAYPTAGNFFIKGGAGVGFSGMDLKMEGVSTSLDMGKGLAVIVGGGYDIPLGRLAITPAFNYWHGSTGDMEFLGVPLLTNVSHNAITATVGVKWP